jgi:predicted  nucleic acid-binding Zn-ribbon protein
MTKISSRPPATGRLTQAGAKALETKLHKLDAQIKVAKADVSKFARQMTLSRYTADGYKKALAHLHTLQKHEKTLEQARAKLIDLMTRA